MKVVAENVDDAKFSPDGRNIAYTTTSQKLLVVPCSGGEEIEICSLGVL